MDVEFLDSGFKEAVEEYRKNFTNPCTAEETLKNANWNVVEIQILLQQVQLLKQVYEAELSQLNPAVVRPLDLRVVKTSLRGMAGASELIQEEENSSHPCLGVNALRLKAAKEALCLASEIYSIQNLRDQYVCEFTREVKKHMTERGLSVVGKWP